MQTVSCPMVASLPMSVAWHARVLEVEMRGESAQIFTR